MSWDELVAAALIGTERRPVANGAPPGAPDELEATLAARGAEERLLGAAAAWTVARRAGARAGEPATAQPVDDDPRPVCSDAAGARLAWLLTDAPSFVSEWLARADELGLRPPPEVVPALLDFGARYANFRVVVPEVAGPLGAWLAEQEPRWSFARAFSDDLWRTGDDRRTHFERLRGSDPERARELLESTFAEETWEDREAFVELLKANLSDADEPFLEAALDDSRKQVRRAAAELLAHLPNSRFAQRNAARVKPLVRVADGQLAVTLPEQPDEAAQRDGFEPGGRRIRYLEELVAAAPLGDPALAALPLADEYGETVRLGWHGATRRQRNVEWARALGDGLLLQVLPREEAEARAIEFENVIGTALWLDWRWGPELSRAFVAAIPQHVAQRSRQTVDRAGPRLHPSVEPELEPLRDLASDVRALCDTVALRAAILQELG